MCLDYCTKEVVPNEEVIVGWKVFRNFFTNKRLSFQFYDHYVCEDTTEEKWIEAKNQLVQYTPDTREYMSGFHVFKTRKDARSYQVTLCLPTVIRKVECKQIRIYGRQDCLDVFVCDKIRILKSRV